jgi:hypothetical protein
MLRLEFECPQAHILLDATNSSCAMTSPSAAFSGPDRFWQRARRSLAYIRDWPANGNSPYSPLFCVSLLLAIGLIIEAGH